MADFATPEHLAAYWRPLATAEQSRATTLLGYAAMFIRQEAPDIDERIAADPNLAEAARWVSVDMVADAMAIAPSHRGKLAFAEAKGPFNQSATFDAGQFGRLRLTDQHRKALGLNTGDQPTWKFGGESCLRW